MLERKTRYLIFQQGLKIRVFRVKKSRFEIDHLPDGYCSVSELKIKKDFLSLSGRSIFWTFPYVTERPGDYLHGKLELFKHKRFTLFYI